MQHKTNVYGGTDRHHVLGARSRDEAELQLMRAERQCEAPRYTLIADHSFTTDRADDGRDEADVRVSIRAS